MGQSNKLKVPNYLKHKPIYEVNNYSLIDGKYAGYSDAIGLSIGLAQWNERGKMDISAKVWRHTGEPDEEYKGGKWSRQSEELPLHRVLDLAIFICKIKEMSASKQSSATINMQGEDMVIEESSGNEYISEDIATLAKFMEENEYLEIRFQALADTLRSLGY